MLLLKKGVKIQGVTAEMVLGIMIIYPIISEYGNCVITSCKDGQHCRGSRHYRGDAVDIRTWYIPKNKEQYVLKELRKALGPDYDVVLHTTHIHVEFDPKK